ncbi:MAG: sugar phosphate nucleotidyltransferase [Candidatus Woesearchaeota archaeon]
MKERVTITLEKNVLDDIDKYVDGNYIKNRSHAIELLVQKSLGLKKLRKALITCGGERKAGFLKNKTTALMEMHDKRILEFTLEMLKKYGIEEVMITLNKSFAKDCKEFFGDGKKYGMAIHYIIEEHPLGTAGAIKQAKEFLTETFVLCNDDNLINLNILEMYKFHNENNATGTLALTTVNDPHEYGVVLVNGNKIYAFIEKPDKDNYPSNIISSGFGIFEPNILELIPDGFSNLWEDAYPKLIKEESLIAFPFPGQWFDVSKKEGFKKAKEKWKGIV